MTRKMTQTGCHILKNGILEAQLQFSTYKSYLALEQSASYNCGLFLIEDRGRKPFLRNAVVACTEQGIGLNGLQGPIQLLRSIGMCYHDTADCGHFL